MFKGLLLVFMLAFVGCATTGTQQDLSVTCPNGVSFHKRDYAPLDFPNEIFAEYGCRRSRVYRYDVNSDGINDIVLNVYYDTNDKPEAWWVLRLLFVEDDKSKATSWAFLRNVDGVAKIVWKNKRLNKQQREWLKDLMKFINEELGAQ